METSKTLTGATSSDLTLFAVDTLANPLVPQASDEAQTTPDICGLGLEKPLASYDHATQCWKMSEDTCLWGEFRLLESLPKSGMTRNGVLYQQPEWVRPIDATELLSWPTPTTQEVEHPHAVVNDKGRRVSRNGKTSHSLGLADAVQMWPTPTIDDSKNVTRKSGVFQSLTRKVMENPWPTPTASSWGNAGSREMLNKHIASGNITEQDKRSMTAGNGGKLNPTWVEWLMGFPTGWTDLED